MSQEKLNGLTILSIEQDLLENIEYKSLISNFQKKKKIIKIEGLIFCTASGLIILRAGHA